MIVEGVLRKRKSIRPATEAIHFPPISCDIDVTQGGVAEQRERLGGSEVFEQQNIKYMDNIHLLPTVSGQNIIHAVPQLLHPPPFAGSLATLDDEKQEDHQQGQCHAHHFFSLVLLQGGEIYSAMAVLVDLKKGLEMGA